MTFYVRRAEPSDAAVLTAIAHAAKLSVVSDPNAESFYRKLGFRRTGEHPSQPEGRVLPVLDVRLRP